MHLFRVGALECAVLNDGDLLLPVEEIFPRELRSDWSPITVDDRRQCHLAINCLLVKSAGRIVLVDTGNGTKANIGYPGGGQLLSELASAGVRPDEVDLVVLTHGHHDHCGGATIPQDGGFVPTFPRARYAIPRRDWEFYTEPERAAAREYVRTDLLPLVEWDRVDLVEETTVAEGVQMLPAPGHSPGHSVVLLSSEGQSVLVLGDLVHHRLQFEEPDLVHRWDVRPELVPGSRRRVARMALELDALVLSAHDPHPGLARLVPRGDGVSLCPIP